MSAEWYVINTFSAQEQKVQSLILKEKQKWDDGYKIETVKVPMLESAELRGNKKRIVKKKLMPGYVFIKVDLDDNLQYKIVQLPGVLRFVSHGNKPQIMSKEEISSIFMEMGDEKQEEKMYIRTIFAEGEEIKIIDGPFMNFQGIIEEVDEEKNKVKVVVEIFGRSTPVELDYLQISKL